jgi:hypothetical protein
MKIQRNNKKAKYYLDTSAIYALSNKFDEINTENVFVSILNLCEIMSKALDGEKYQKRKSALLKIPNLNMCELLPNECIAVAFNFNLDKIKDISRLKKDLNNSIHDLVHSNSYYDYKIKIQNNNIEDINFLKRMEDEKSKIKSEIDSDVERLWKEIKNMKSKNDKIEFDKIKKENVINKEKLYYDFNDRKNGIVKYILRKLLEDNNIDYTKKQFNEIIEEYNNGLDIYLFANYMFFYYRATTTEKKVDKNDYVDILHALYLNDESYKIVSNDNIFDIILKDDMKLTVDEFLKIRKQ